LFGFILSTVIKWFVSFVFFGGSVWTSVLDALTVRVSQSSAGLNPALSDYSANFAQLPTALRAIVLNCMVFASKIIDPRFSSLIGVFLVSFMLVLFITFFASDKKLRRKLSLGNTLVTLPIIGIPFFYYALTPNHSFNHAVIVYRALPIVLGFIITYLYLLKTKNIASVD